MCFTKYSRIGIRPIITNMVNNPFAFSTAPVFCNFVINSETHCDVVDWILPQCISTLIVLIIKTNHLNLMCRYCINHEEFIFTALSTKTSMSSFCFATLKVLASKVRTNPIRSLLIFFSTCNSRLLFLFYDGSNRQLNKDFCTQPRQN